MSFRAWPYAIALAAITLSGCKPNPNPYPFDRAKFGAMVTSWQLKGATPTEASAALEQKGFRVSRHKAEKYFDGQRDYLYATQKVGRIVCSLEWRVILALENEKVAEVSPYVFSQCL